ncbi:urocortin-3 [Tenrec ecaudatus]|uniref:urocortin-3 n=1 Tax=Tenrec ecaudatus TaxID=94439 RepID=UPI003F59937A
MVMPGHFLLLLLLVTPSAGLSHKFCKPESLFSCINTALAEAKKNQLEDKALLSRRSFHYLPSQDPAPGTEEEENQEDKQKRTFLESGGGSVAGNTRYKSMALAQPRGKLYQDKVKSDRRSKFTLSLDVPTNIMNILFNIAKAKNLRAKAAANAHLMAQVGRKK